MRKEFIYMKKNLRLISTAAAALLAVAPIATPIVTQASSTIVSAASMMDKNFYFATADGDRVLANNETVSAKEAFTPNGKTTLAQLKQDIRGTVGFFNDKNAPLSMSEWNNYVFGEDNATSNRNLVSQLRNAGIAVTGTKDTDTFNPGNVNYTLTIRSNGGQRVNISFHDTFAVNETYPAFQVRSDESLGGQWSNPVTDTASAPVISVVERDSGTFTPSKYIRAINNIHQHALINYRVVENNVDWTKAGLYTVKVQATNSKGTTTISIPVAVMSENGKMVTATKAGNFYRENANGELVQTNLLNGAIQPGQVVHVFGDVQTKMLNGQAVQVYRAVAGNANVWVLADTFAKEPAKPVTPERVINPVTRKIMHAAAIYDKEGKRTADPVVHAYNSVLLDSTLVTINGAKYYEMLDGQNKATGKFVKASNIDGSQKSLTHNSYIYKSNGKRANRKVYKTGQTVTVYGGQLKYNNRLYYRIGVNRYIKAANFR